MNRPSDRSDRSISNTSTSTNRSYDTTDSNSFQNIATSDTVGIHLVLSNNSTENSNSSSNQNNSNSSSNSNNSNRKTSELFDDSFVVFSSSNANTTKSEGSDNTKSEGSDNNDSFVVLSSSNTTDTTDTTDDFYECDQSNCSHSKYVLMTNTTDTTDSTTDTTDSTTDTTDTTDTNDGFYECIQSNCSQSKYESVNADSNTSVGEFYSCQKPNCKNKQYNSSEVVSSGYKRDKKKNKKSRKHHRSHRSHRKNRNKCSDSCDTKDCKYCKIFGISPQYLGAHFLVANEVQSNKIQSNKGSFQEIWLDGYKVSPYAVKDRETKRINIHDSIDNREFYFCDSNCEELLDNLTYKCNQSSPQGGLVRSVCISGCNIISESLEDVIYKPTFKSKGAADTQVDITLVVAKVDKYSNNGIRYATYKVLDKTSGVVLRNKENTVTIVWKGPLPVPFRKSSKHSDSYLWFFVNIKSSNDEKLIDIADTNTPDITLTY